jgi:hypothetical protein
MPEHFKHWNVPKKNQQSGQLMKSWLTITVSYTRSKVLLSGHGARKKPQKHQIYPQLPFHKSFSKSSPTALALPRVLLPTCHEAQAIYEFMHGLRYLIYLLRCVIACMTPGRGDHPFCPYHRGYATVMVRCSYLASHIDVFVLVKSSPIRYNALELTNFHLS